LEDGNGNEIPASKPIFHFKSMKKYRKGQILLITVMILAIVMTVLLSVTFQSTTETQTTKLEQESEKALAAAEAAIEASLKSGGNVTFGTSTQLSNLTGFTGGATIGSVTSNTFTSSTVAKDSAYTFYLGNYNTTNKTIGASINQDVTVCFNSASPDPAIEITLIKTNGIQKYVVDPDSRIANAYDPTSGCTADQTFEYSYTVPGADIGAVGRILFVRVLYSSSKLAIFRSTDLPLQGTTISSEAKSTAGVSKKVVLFQSYPQIPAEFFSTTF
jgi:type II secretory pathway pseudopilin PulG